MDCMPLRGGQTCSYSRKAGRALPRQSSELGGESTVAVTVHKQSRCPCNNFPALEYSYRKLQLLRDCTGTRFLWQNFSAYRNTQPVLAGTVKVV